MTDKQDEMLLARYHRANNYAAELEAERDALRAENERLRNGDGLEYSLSLTNADLRAENERLHDIAAAAQRRMEQLETENEGLRDEVADYEDRVRLDAGLMEADHAEIERLRAALRRITEQGRVCAEFETCRHVACQSSYEAWAVADTALKGETPESANERALREFGSDKAG